MKSVAVERYRHGEKVLLVSIGLYGQRLAPTDFVVQEFNLLAMACGVKPVAKVCLRVRKPCSYSLIGRGQLDNLREQVREHGAEAVLLDTDLSPAQERNLEKELCCRVLSRTGIILDIFAQRAHTYEGRLQVELAQLQHLSTRLVRGWSHLERQRGGIGLRGPGETQLETDRRLIGKRIRNLKKMIVKLHTQRELGREKRRASLLPRVALVGYTNAGKSSLFNRLTHAEVDVRDEMFVTLDPRYRRVRLAGGLEFLLADTVGFVSNLPHELVDAFASTLEEVRQAEALIHLVDVSHPAHMDMIGSVRETLQKLQVEDKPQLMVFNKTDLLEGDEQREAIAPSEYMNAVSMSVATGEGVQHLEQAMQSLLEPYWAHRQIYLPSSQAAARSWLFANQAVVWEDVGDDGVIKLHLSMSRMHWKKFLRVHQLSEAALCREETTSIPV